MHRDGADGVVQLAALHQNRRRGRQDSADEAHGDHEQRRDDMTTRATRNQAPEDAVCHLRHLELHTALLNHRPNDGRQRAGSRRNERGNGRSGRHQVLVEGRCQRGGRVEREEPNQQQESAEEQLDWVVARLDRREHGFFDLRHGVLVPLALVALDEHVLPDAGPRAIVGIFSDAGATQGDGHERANGAGHVHQRGPGEVDVAELAQPTTAPHPLHTDWVDHAGEHHRQHEVGEEGDAARERAGVDRCRSRCVREVQKPQGEVEAVLLDDQRWVAEGDQETGEVVDENAEEEVHAVLHHDVGGVRRPAVRRLHRGEAGLHRNHPAPHCQQKDRVRPVPHALGLALRLDRPQHGREP
mmetsp:Transcript_51426/g.148398  ORF Transcript_51426/g.148398 Transcript_51426/m.148398 type:complete len:356 (+) Transcript_51426:1064-2131(+)